MTYPYGRAPSRSIETADIEIGAVEIKDASAATRAKVAATSSVAEGDNALTVQAPVLGATNGAALDADGAGTLQQYLRGLLKAFLVRIPVLGQQLAAASLSTVPASDANVATETGGNLATIAGDTTSLDNKVPALGVASSAASSPVVLASDDAHLGAVGAAAAVDGVLHGQLRYVGEAVDNIPAQGAAAAAASLPVTLATEDAAKIPALGQALPASSTPVVEAAQHLGTGGQVIAIGAASVRSTQLATGLWRISASGDCWLRQGGSTVDATKAVAGSTFLAAGAIDVALVTSSADGYIAVIQDASETGNVSLTQIG